MPHVRTVVASVLLAALASSKAAPQRPGQPCAIAIIGPTVIDGNGGAPLADATVLVRNGKFEQVGKRADVKVPDCAQKVDGTGKFATPGFVDTNVHNGMPTSAAE